MSRYVSQDYLPASGAFVGLSAPGEVGSWQRECKVINFISNDYLLLSTLDKTVFLKVQAQ